MQFGISTHLYRNERLQRRHLEEVAEHGFETIELCAMRPHFDYHDPAAIDDLSGWLEDTGLSLHGVHAPVADEVDDGRWTRPYSTASRRPGEQRAALAEIESAVAVLRRIPARVLVVHLGVPTALGPGAHDNDVDAGRRGLEAIARMLEPLHARMAVEVISNDLSTPAALARLVDEQIELSSAGICLDFGHAFLQGDLVDAVETLSGHLVSTHVHDNHGRVDEHLVPFDGDIDWPAALMAMQKVGYEDGLILELGPTASSTLVLDKGRRARRQIERLLTH